MASPPSVYVGAVFPASSFAAAFDREVPYPKYPVNLVFDFPEPYLASMDKVRESGYWKVMSRSQIVLLTVSDISQEASVFTTFEDLNRFINNPLGDAYGYPIFCRGFYC